MPGFIPGQNSATKTASRGSAYCGKNKKVVVSGTVQRTGVYCGGARPTDEILQSIMEPKPLSGKKLFVKKGKTNDLSKTAILEFTSDSLGNFSITLPPGDYCIVDEFKNSKTNYQNILSTYKTETKDYSAVDPECLRGWFSEPDLVIVVPKSGLKNIKVIYVDKCPWNKIPCVTYHGPLPP